MARELHRLSAIKVSRSLAPGMHADGGGLYLRVTGGAKGGRRWVFLYKRPSDGKRCELGLGGLGTVPLAKARKKAAEARSQLDDGIDPLQARRAALPVPTFGEVADRLIESLQEGWRNEKHRAQWQMTMREYAKPLRSKPVNEIDTPDVLAVLRPIWLEKPETAGRVRGRIERVLDAAKVEGHRSGENPAAWRGHLALLLPRRPVLSRGHFARMPIDDVPAFMSQLRKRDALAARCLEFAILTATRSGEALGASWAEIDRSQRVWIIPAARMKAGREHRVPLSKRALEILADVEALGTDGFVFPGQSRGKPLSPMALEMVLRRMKVTNATVHGFRSCFRDWAGNMTSFPRELAEHALSHAIGDKAEQAYRRDDALERRRPMMEAWSTYCCASSTDNVLTMIARQSIRER